MSSDIWRVEIGARKYCLKRALPQLKVASLWQAPVERNDAEWKWLATAETIWPGSVPHLVAQDRDAGLFVMEYLDPARYPNWKSQLRDGVLREETARAVAERLVAIHAATAGRADIAAEFDTGDCFYAIRLEPYLIATARVHTGSRAATGSVVGQNAGDQMRAGAWRRQPEKYPDRPGRSAVHRFGMRLVRRARLRPRLLPQPSAAEMPVAAAQCARLSAPVRWC